MTGLRYVGVLLIYQEMVVIALIPQVFICLQRLNFRTESIGRTDVIKTGEKKHSRDKDWYNKYTCLKMFSYFTECLTLVFTAVS